MSESRILTAQCGKCGCRLRVKTHSAAKVVPCPKCHTTVTASQAPNPSSSTNPNPGPVHAFPCPNCGSNLEVERHLIGQITTCRDCEQRIKVPRPLPSKTPQGDYLPREQAEAIVRAAAEKHGAKGALSRLGNIDPKLVANAKAGFAREMCEGEVPLVLMDRSFLENGKAGVLVTNRALYSSTASEPVPLGDILSATVEEPTQLQQLLIGGLGPLGYGIFRLCGGESLWPKLLVNGEIVYEGKINAAFWKDLLPQLALAYRNGAGRTAVRRNIKKQMRNADELAWLVAAAVCSGKDKHATLADFAYDGADPARVGAMADAMIRLRTAPRRGVALGLLAAGIAMVLAGLTLTFASEGDWIWYGPVVFGIPLAGIGLFRLANGSPPLKTADLKAKWDACGDSSA